jgi:hypothetical protein
LRLSTYQGVLVPGHVSLLVGVGVGVSLNGTGATTEKSVQVRTDLVGTAGLDGVALRTTGLDYVSVQLKAIDRRIFIP